MPVNKTDVEPTPPKDDEPKETTPKATEVSKSKATAEPVKQDRPEPKVQEEIKPQSYVWLADGSVLRVNDEDLPGASGAANPHGHWQTGNKVFEIVGIYPTESVVEDN